MHSACPNKKQNRLQNSLLRRTQFWIRKTFSKQASLKRASLVLPGICIGSIPYGNMPSLLWPNSSGTPLTWFICSPNVCLNLSTCIGSKPCVTLRISYIRSFCGVTPPTFGPWQLWPQPWLEHAVPKQAPCWTPQPVQPWNPWQTLACTLLNSTVRASTKPLTSTLLKPTTCSNLSNLGSFVHSSYLFRGLLWPQKP